MSLAPKPISSAVVGLVLLATSTVAQAHPGHDHADIPSVLRHPLAGPDHLAISGAVGLAVGAIVFLATRRTAMPAVARWLSAWAVALAVAVGLSI